MLAELAERGLENLLRSRFGIPSAPRVGRLVDGRGFSEREPFTHWIVDRRHHLPLLALLLTDWSVT
jgi:hypothetical protein